MRIEYLAGRGYPAAEPEVRGALLNVPAIREAVEGGLLAIGGVIPVTAFSANHTIKRSILDRRL